MEVTKDTARGPNFHPPWKGPKGAEYGPRSSSEYARKVADHRHTLEGGGLWDMDRDINAERRKEAHTSERYDMLPMIEYVEEHSANISHRLLEVYCLYWVDGRSLSAVAKIMLEKRVGTGSLASEDYRRALSRCKSTTKRQINDLRKLLVKSLS
jgi:hypothetical protein